MTGVRKNHQSLGLAMIMKNEVEELHRIIDDYGKYFDKIYVTVTSKKTYTILQEHFAEKPNKKIEPSYFKWIDHFGKARRFNQQQVKTDYWMWIDLDDEIERAEKLVQVIQHMHRSNLDAVWLQYDTIRRVNASEPESVLWRERIIRTASELEWNDNAIHESIDAKGNIKEEFLPDVIIKHRKTAEQSLESKERNRLLLEKDWKKTHRASTAYYLGTSFGEIGDYESAIEKLSYAAEHGRNNALKFAAWQNLCICYFQIERYDMALTATGECIAIEPDHPGPWYQRFEIYKKMGQLSAAVESAEVAMNKRIQGESLTLNHDATWYQYKGPFSVAQAYLSLGNVERAYQLCSEVKKIAPEYIEEQGFFFEEVES